MEMKWILTIGLVAAMTVHGVAAHAWDEYPGFSSPGHAGIAIGDFDGDGTLEAAITGTSGNHYSSSQLLAVLGADVTGQLGIRVMSMLMTPLTGPMIAAPREGAADRLAVVAGDGSANLVAFLGDVPLRIVRTIQAPLVRRVVAIADVDADGRLDIVALAAPSMWGDAFPTVLDYETGAIKWTGPDPVTGVGVAQLDGDAALELILSGTPGRIVDGATHAVEWAWPSGFGSKILVGRFGADANVGFATMSPWSSVVQIFRSQPYSPVSEIATGQIAAAAVVQLSPGGADQIAVDNDQWGDVVVYDPRTGQRLVSIPNDSHGMSALAAGDLDGDGHVEIVFGAGLNSSGTDVLRAVDLDTLVDDYRRNDEIGPHSALARGDLQGGGADQVAYLTARSNSGYDGSNLYVLDAASGKRLRMRSNVVDSWSGIAPRVALAQLDGDAQQEIIVAGGHLYAGLVIALDGVSLADQWRTGGYGSVFGDTAIRDLATIDANGDGTPDVVVATAASRLVVLDGRDGSVLWQSITLNGSTAPSVAVFRSATGDPRVAIARGAGLYVFDLTSHLLVATAKTAMDVIGVTQWGQGEACRIAALDETAKVTIHRCDTLASEGQRQLPAGSVFFRPLDEHGDRFIAASGAYLHEVAPDGTSIPMAGPLGNELGAGNLGIVSQPDPQHVEVLIGSDYLVTRRLLGFDAMFANSFD